MSGGCERDSSVKATIHMFAFVFLVRCTSSTVAGHALAAVHDANQLSASRFPMQQCSYLAVPYDTVVSKNCALMVGISYLEMR